MSATVYLTGKVQLVTLGRIAFVLLCFAPQLRYLLPQAGFAVMVVATLLGFASCLSMRVSWTSALLAAYFGFLGSLGLLVQLFGDVPQGMPEARPHLFYALTTLAHLFVALAIVRRPDGNWFILRTLSWLLVIEVSIVALQAAFLIYGIGFAPTVGDSIQDNLLEGSYGNPNNAAVVLGLVLMLLITSGYLRLSSFLGALLTTVVLAALFVTLSRTVLIVVVLFLLVVSLWPRLDGHLLVRWLRNLRHALPSLLVLGLGVFALMRWSPIADLTEAGVFERSFERVGTLSVLDQDDSVDFRVMSTLRLVQNLDEIGFGTLSDSNYGAFFEAQDPWLATTNPHSYIVEMSFLFGYPGLLLSASFLTLAALRILHVNPEQRLLASLLALAVLAFQMVPSSLFPLGLFFVLAVLAGERGLSVKQHVPQRQASARRAREGKSL